MAVIFCKECPGKVVNRALTYVNASTPLKVTKYEIDLDLCYKIEKIVVKVRTAAFNSSDFTLHDFGSKWLLQSRSKTIGRDFAGVIVKAGEHVDKEWAVGDKVCGLFDAFFNEQGAMRDYLVFDPESSRTQLLCKIPEFKNPNYNDFVLGASWPLVFSTALQGFTEFGQKLGPESNVLVLGAGTCLGWYVAKIAKELFNVTFVVGACSKEYVERRVNSLGEFHAGGCDTCVVFDWEDSLTRLKKTIKNLLNGQEFDIIFDCIGYNDLIPHVDDYLKPKSENSHYVNISGKAKYEFDAINKGSMWNNITSMFQPDTSFNYHFLQLHTAPNTPHAFKELVESIREKDKYFDYTIDGVHSLDQYGHEEKTPEWLVRKGRIRTVLFDQLSPDSTDKQAKPSSLICISNPTSQLSLSFKHYVIPCNKIRPSLSH